MKPFQVITVFVEFAYNGPDDGRDDNIPCRRLIRARVAETVTPNGGVCRAWGTELVAPRKLTDHDMMSVHALCLAQLRGITQHVTFRYDPPLGLDPETYPVEVA